MERIRARDVREAERLLRQGLALSPDHGPALRQLALIVGREGRDAECVALLERAVAGSDGDEAAASGLLLAAAHARAGRPAEAETAYRDVLEAAPRSTEALVRLALLLRGQDRDAEAAGLLRTATDFDPSLAVAHAALAAALHATGDLAGAAASAERALALAPDDIGFAGALALIRNAQGRFEEAAALCRTALAQGPDPALLNTLGVALKESDDLEAAAAAFEQAAALRPGFVEALFNLAAARKDQGATDEAVGLLREVVRLAPDLAAARFALCMAHLPPLYADEAETARRRADYTAELDALIAHAERCGAGALAAGVGAAQPFYLAYQGRNDRDLQARYGALVCRAMAEAYPPAPLAAAPQPGERIRVGVACGHIRAHSVWRLPTRGWVAALDRSRFEVIGYHTSGLCDAETARARDLFDRFVQGPLPIAAWRERIAADRPHALIYPEIGMDPAVARLAAMRLAPAQYASWGHPSTSGYPTIDAFLSSAAMEPADADAEYTERLVRLPGLSTSVTFEPLTRPVPARAALCLPEDATIYWCGQSLYKYLPQHDHLFAEIAARHPDGRFAFFEFPGSPALTCRFQARLAASFAARGLDAERVCVVLPRMTPAESLAATGCADVVLDCVDWSGCNSLLDALVHDLPIVTLPGETLRARHGAAILRQLGLDALIATTKADFVDKAVALGADAAARRAAAARIAQHKTRLLEDTAWLAPLEQHIISAAQDQNAFFKDARRP